MKCPVCGVQMDRLGAARGVTLDVCGTCRGTWFDSGEFSATLDKENAQVSARNCPQCVEPALMMGSIDGDGPHADFCKSCGGVWVDSMAIDQLQKNIDPLHPLADFLMALRSTHIKKNEEKRIHRRPAESWDRIQQSDWEDDGPAYIHREKTYKHFQTVQSSVEFVLGEFYWKIHGEDRTLVRDFIRPPMMISQETTARETTWSLGEYVDPAEIRQAFGIVGDMPAREGVFANQPSAVGKILGAAWTLAGAALVAGALIVAVVTGGMRKQIALTAPFTYRASDAEKSRVSEIFPLEGHLSNVLVRTSTNLAQSWAYFSMALINVQTGVAMDFGREIAYYHGRDADGSWAEGSTGDEVFLPAIAPGHYYLRVEPESNATEFTYTIEIARDMPRVSYVLFAFTLLLLPPLLLSWRHHRFEYNRWAESDHPIVYSEDDDE